MFHRKQQSVLTMAALTAAMAVGLADKPTPVSAADPAPSSGTPIEINIKPGSNDGKAMDDALAKLQAAMAEQAKQAVVTQQVILKSQDALARQLKQLTGSPDALAEARKAGLLEYNAAIYRWAIDVAAMPDDKRDAVFAWGLTGDNIALVAKIYGRDSDAKIEAIKAVAALEVSPASDALMQMLLNDRDREVSLLAIDALYNRKLTAAMVDALCDKAFGAQMNQARQRPNQQQMHVVTVHGRTINYYDNPNNYNTQDADIAIDLLIANKDPRAVEKFDAFLADVASSINNVNDGRVLQLISPNYGNSGPIARLVEAFKSKGMVQLCEKVLEFPSSNSQEQTMNLDGAPTKVRMSTRVDAAMMLARATGQDPASLGLTTMPNYSPPRWVVRGGAIEENELLKKLHAWMTEHGKQYGVDAVGTYPEVPVPANAQPVPRPIPAGLP